jgi:outer membrane biosynthesis protein TonB
MRKVAWALVVLAFFTTAAWTQEAAPTASPAQSGTPTSAHSTATTGPNPGAPPACPAKFDDSLEKDGIADKNSEGVVAPKLKSAPLAKFSNEARHADSKDHFDGFKSVIGFVVGADGRAEDICLVTAAGYGLDANAAKAVRLYRFDPATKDGQPVRWRTAAEVSFRFY